MRVFIKYIIYLSFAIFVFSCAGSRPDRGYLQNQNVTCNNIISASKPWMGTPYKYGGVDFRGVDCSAFVQSVFQQVFNKKIPRTTGLMYQQGNIVRGGGLVCGDLVFFKNVRGRAGVDHVGIYIGNKKFIHASTSRGVVISDLASNYYSSHYVAARRY